MGLSAACSAPLQASGLPDTCDSFTHPCPWTFGLSPGLVLRVQRCDSPVWGGSLLRPPRARPLCLELGQHRCPSPGCLLVPPHGPLSSSGCTGQGGAAAGVPSLPSRCRRPVSHAAQGQSHQLSLLPEIPIRAAAGSQAPLPFHLSARGTHSSWIPRNGVAGSQDRHVRTRLSETPPKGFPRWFSKSTCVITKPRFRCSCILTNVWNCPSF